MPPDLDPADFARYIMTVMEGMSVRAAARREPRGAAQDRRHGAARLAGVRCCLPPLTRDSLALPPRQAAVQPRTALRHV